MSEHADEALDMLDRVGRLDRGKDHQQHYELGYLLVGAIVRALLDVAEAIRERE